MIISILASCAPMFDFFTSLLENQHTVTVVTPSVKPILGYR